MIKNDFIDDILDFYCIYYMVFLCIYYVLQSQLELLASQITQMTEKFNFSYMDTFIIFMLLLTELVLSDQGLRDARWPTAVLVLSSDSKDVFLPFDEFADGAAGALQGGGDGDPANLIVLVVLLLQDVVQDLAATIIFRRLPVTDDRGVPYVIEGEVDWSAGFVCVSGESGRHLND